MLETGITMGSGPPRFLASGTVTALEALREFGHGRRVIGLTKGQFDLLDLIRAAMGHTGPVHLALSTWTLGIRDVENAAFLIERGDLLSLRLLVDRSFATRHPDYCRRVVEVFGSGAIRATNTHAKIAILRNDNWAVAIRSSMNFNRNPRFEQFDIDESVEICEFFERWLAELEELTPPGPSQDMDVINDVFAAALDGLTHDQFIRERSRVARRMKREERAHAVRKRVQR